MVFQKIKDILGMGEKEKEEKPEAEQLQRLSLEKLRKKVEDRKSHPIQKSEADIGSILGKISEAKKEIENLSSDLASAEPDEEIHPNVYKSAKEARRLLLQKMDRAVEKIDTPSKEEWRKLLDFNRSLQDAVNLLKNANLNHGGQAATVFEEEVNRLTRLIDKIQPLSSELNTSLRKIKLNLDDLGEILEEISRREDLLDRKRDLKDGLEELKNQKGEIEKEYKRVADSLDSLKRSDRFEELKEMKGEIKELSQQKDQIRGKIETTISKLKRPLRKMNKMIERDEHMVGKEVLDALDSYLKEPVETTLSEEEGLPKFRSMLKELENVLQGKMKLDDRERGKRLQEVRDILQKNKLSELQEKFFEIESGQTELKKERKSSSLLEKKERLENSFEKKKSNLSKVEKRIKESEKELRDIRRQIKEANEKIQERAKSLFDIEVEI